MTSQRATQIAGHSRRYGCEKSLRARGLTLVEMLVAMTLTLVLMGAVAQIFGMLGQGINGSRSMAELNDRMRATANRLRQDLAGITVHPSPPVSIESNSGYLEIIEGPETDLVTYFRPNGTPFFKSNGAYNPSTRKWEGNSNPYQDDVGSDDRLVGDIDDVLLFTTRSTGEPFSGRIDTRSTAVNGGTLKTPYAEVLWFCRRAVNATDPRTYTLYRRQRLVSAQPGAPPFVNPAAGQPANSFGGPPNSLPFTNWPDIYALTDVSCRKQGDLAVPNTLGDLTRRENRFMHAVAFPHPFPIPLYLSDNSSDLASLTFDSNSSRMGEDIVLTNVLAFDVRVWDPAVTVQATPAIIRTRNNNNAAMLAVVPGDPMYNNPGNVVISSGAYVDLTFGAVFAGPGKDVTKNHSLLNATYDTWSTYYENNGVDDDNVMGIDQGTNGVDDDRLNGIDDAAEKETTSPYQADLPGIQVRLRCYDPSTRQIRQITVLHSF